MKRFRLRRAFRRFAPAPSRYGRSSISASRSNTEGREGMTDVRTELDALYRSESRRVLATLIRLLGDFDLAEEALHEAFVAAMQRWPAEGMPRNPRAWLVSTGRFKAIDALRRRARFDVALQHIADRLDQSSMEDPADAPDAI